MARRSTGSIYSAFSYILLREREEGVSCLVVVNKLIGEEDPFNSMMAAAAKLQVGRRMENRVSAEVEKEKTPNSPTLLREREREREGMGITCRVDSNKKCNEESARAAAGDREREKERNKPFGMGGKRGLGGGWRRWVAQRP